MSEDSSHGGSDSIEARMVELETEVERLSRKVRIIGALLVGAILFLLVLQFPVPLLLVWPILVAVGTAVLYVMVS